MLSSDIEDNSIVRCPFCLHCGEAHRYGDVVILECGANNSKPNGEIEEGKCCKTIRKWRQSSLERKEKLRKMRYIKNRDKRDKFYMSRKIKRLERQLDRKRWKITHGK